MGGWANKLGIWLLGGFVVYLIAAGRFDAYLSLFMSSSQPTVVPSPSATQQTSSIFQSSNPVGLGMGIISGGGLGW